ncbi:heme NO-binding domain-containing protein [Maricurvus nonylphenolicus]|uniref:heme NO-binding domain-containing protein n=1 Tax=Maricurvus nonylphenolicus TaxID=1008307 RepID=UPI0036F35796
MRGVILTNLCDMIEERYGLKFLNDVIDASQLPSGGIYTAGGNYDGAEVASIVATLEKLLGIPQEFIIRNYGEFLAIKLSEAFPAFFEVDGLKAFLKTVDHHIHVEVEKLYPESELPKFTFEDPGDNKLVMHYYSSRKLCHLAEGLIEGAAKYFNEECSLVHSTCMHRGDEYCTFEMAFYEAE